MIHGRFVGIPWKPNGRDFDGVDCYGLIVLWYREILGINLMDFTTQTTDEEFYLDNIDNYWVEVKKYHEKENDVIVTRERTGQLHVALIYKPCQILHINIDETSKLERYRWNLWKAPLRIYRHRHLL